MLSLIQVKKNLFTRVEVCCEPLCKKQPPSEAYEVTIGVTEPINVKQSNLWQLCLDVKLKTAKGEEPCRYQGHLTIQGTFEISENVELEKRETFIKANGASLLLGSVREMILAVTSRSAWGPYVLPAFDPRMFIGESVSDADTGIAGKRKA